jgi:hypothetical protein
MNWLGRLGVLGLVFLLSSCYIPDKFKAELRLSRFGDYSLSFDGDLLHVPTLHEYARGNIKPDDEAERLENIRRDLVRDVAFKEIVPKGKGRFGVRYEREGRLGKVQLVALIRRDARLLSLKSHENGAIVVAASSPKPSDAQRMSQMNVSIQGEFRLTTDANILEHNAAEVRPFGRYNVYIWKIENTFSPVPRFLFVRDPDPSRPLPEPKSAKQ